MSDPKTVEAVESATKPVGSAATEISFCPHLGIYRYKRADGVDYMFDNVQLEQAIESYIKAANPREAEFMAFLTACARKCPHQVVAFDEHGQCNLQELVEKSPYPNEPGQG